MTEHDSAAPSFELEPRPTGLPATPAAISSSKSGRLRKLGGKQRDQWRPVDAQLSAEGLCWTSGSAVRDRASGSQSVLAPAQILSVAYYSEIGVEHAFEVASRAKGGKVYKFAAESFSRPRSSRAPMSPPSPFPGFFTFVSACCNSRR